MISRGIQQPCALRNTSDTKLNFSTTKPILKKVYLFTEAVTEAIL